MEEKKQFRPTQKKTFFPWILKFISQYVFASFYK